MIFTTLEFVIFFVFVYGLYIVLGHKGQNRLLLVASYAFYAAWDWRFLSLIFFSTALDYICGRQIDDSKSPQRRKLFLYVSVIGNLSVLFFFKYFNFFLDNLYVALQLFGVEAAHSTLKIILPVGISFYTFQTLSYTIDIYRREMSSTKNFWDFALFVAFFPQLVAGPIERARHLLPQISKPRQFTAVWIREGIFLILWGVFQKVYIADNVAEYVNSFYSQAGPYNMNLALLAVYAFTFQIFCDFAAYSNIARGLGRLMGFDIMINFAAPFFVTNVQEFWNKWHISLSSWIRDYLYFPMFKALRDVRGNMRIYIALIVSMFLIGLWHGAAWNFVIFGLYYGVLLVLYLIIRPYLSVHVNPKSAVGKNLWLWLRMIFIFHLTVVGMSIFRSQSWTQAADVLLSLTRFHEWQWYRFRSEFIDLFSYVWLLLVVQYFQSKKSDALVLMKAPVCIRWGTYALMFLLIFFKGNFGSEEFIYFFF